MYINGEWITLPTTFSVINPATGEEIGQVADGGRNEADAAIDAAHNAFASWSKTTAYERSALLYRAWQLMIDRKEQLA